MFYKSFFFTLGMSRYSMIIMTLNQLFVVGLFRCMLAGKWHYMSKPEEFFLASVPLLSAICHSSTNVDMCDRKFQVGTCVTR